MNGSWKNNVSGWNAKDTKRKKQTHNHRLRDNGTYVIKTFDGWKNKNEKVNTEVFRTETETVLVTKGKYGSDKAIRTTAKVYRVFITINEVDKDGNFIEDYKVKSDYTYSGWNITYKKIFKEINVYSDGNRGNLHNKGNHYIEKTDKSIAEHFRLTSKQLAWCEIEGHRDTQRIVLLPEEMIKNAIERKNVIKVEDHDEDGDFIYGKPLASWKRMTFFGDGKRRKYAQNRANRTDRRNIKNWIDGHDISKPLKTHALSKSILWEIH